MVLLTNFGDYTLKIRMDSLSTPLEVKLPPPPN
jgi:hypothetical protein